MENNINQRILRKKNSSFPSDIISNKLSDSDEEFKPLSSPKKYKWFDNDDDDDDVTNKKKKTKKEKKLASKEQINISTNNINEQLINNISLCYKEESQPLQLSNNNPQKSLSSNISKKIQTHKHHGSVRERIAKKIGFKMQKSSFRG